MKDVNLTKLIITVFLISWVGVTPSLLLAYDINIPSYIKSLEILMTLGPILGAVIFIYKSSGRSGQVEFFKRILWYKASIKVILFIFLLPIAVSFLSSIIGLQLSNSPWPENYSSSTIISNGIIIFLMYLLLNREELVWRGLVFDRFLKSNGFVKSCLKIIPIWWLFHIPLFLYPDGHQAGSGILEFTCIVVAQTFILGWIYLKTSRSLFMSIFTTN